MEQHRWPSYGSSIEVGPHWVGGQFVESVAARQRQAEEAMRLLQGRRRKSDGRTLRMSVEQRNAEETERQTQQERRAWKRTRPAAQSMRNVLMTLPPNDRSFALGQLIGEAMKSVSNSKGEAITRVNHVEDCALVVLAYLYAGAE